MTYRITAQEAYSIANEGYKKQMDKKVSDHLANIYDRVHQAAQNGNMHVKAPILIWGDEYRDKLSDLLKQDGFKCNYNSEDFTGVDYINISWNHQK